MLSNNWRKEKYAATAVVESDQIKNWSCEVEASCRFGNLEALQLLQKEASSQTIYELVT